MSQTAGTMNSPNNAAGWIQSPPAPARQAAPLRQGCRQCGALASPSPGSSCGFSIWEGVRQKYCGERTLRKKKTSQLQKVKFLPETSPAKAVHHSSAPFDRRVNAVPIIAFIQTEGVRGKTNQTLHIFSESQLLQPNICHCANLILLFGSRFCLAVVGCFFFFP